MLLPETSLWMRPHWLPRDGEGGGGSWGEERPLGEPPTLGGNSRPAEVPVDSGSFIAIVMGLEVRLQWVLVKISLLKRRVRGGPTPGGDRQTAAHDASGRWWGHLTWHLAELLCL